MNRALLCLVLCLVTPTASAETVRVRSGEHADFSRLVLDIAAPVTWRFGRIAGGYGLRVARDGIQYDLARVFDLIPRQRLARISPASGASGLDLGVTCECYAELVEMRPGVLVIDLHDGKAPAGSPFEAMLDVPELVAAAVPHTAEPLSISQQDRLKFFWGAASVPGPGSDSGSVNPAAPEPAAPDVEMPDAGMPNAVMPETATAPDGSALDAHATAPPADHPASLLPASLLPASPDLDVLPEPGVPVPHIPISERVAEAQGILLEQIGRAASQGLLQADTLALPDLPTETIAVAEDLPAAAEPGSTPHVQAADPDSHIRLTAETSIDRDTLHSGPTARLTENGGTCLDDALLDLREWGTDTAPADQIAEKRRSLIGEFDAPSAAAVGELARLYLYLGFGAEAREVLHSFGVAVPNSDLLDTLGQIVDGVSVTDPGRLAGQMGCDGASALWSVLAAPDLAAGDAVALGAVIRSFSRLPLQLRRHVGPLAAEKFLSIGDAATARALRDAITRAPGDPGDEVRLISAQLDLDRAKPELAEAELVAVIAQDGAAAPEALILYIDLQIARNRTVAAAQTAAAAALAFEHRGTKLGARLARAQILGLAASGSVEAAFATLAQLETVGPDALPAPLDTELFELLMARSDDAAFLQRVFAESVRLEHAALPHPLRQAMSERLLRLGFAPQARTILAAGSAPSDRDRLILGRAALTEHDPASALRQIAGMTGAEPAKLRAEALTATGDDAGAAVAYAEAGQPDAQSSASWRAGDLEAVARLGTAEQQAAVAALLANTGPEPAPQPPPSDPAGAPAAEPAGPLALNRELLAESQATREELAALLNAFPTLQAP